MGYMTEDCCGERTIHIEASDFCKKCGKYAQYSICDECRKIPVTFADGIEDE